MSITKSTSITKKFIEAISKAKTKKGRKTILNKRKKTFEKQIIRNAEGIFKNKSSLAGFKNTTLKTMRKTINKAVNSDTFDEQKLKNSLNYQLKRGKGYQKQVRRLERDEQRMDEQPNNTKYEYIQTVAVKTGLHDPECDRRLAESRANNGVSKETALDEMQELPAHPNCTCHYIKISNVLIKSGNF